MTSEQLAEWEAYNRLEPIGDERIEFSLAMISSVLTNIAIAALGKPGAKQTTPLDFLPKWDAKEETKPKTKKQSVEEMKEILKTIATVYGSNRKGR